MINLYDFQKEYIKDLPAKFIMAAETGVGKTFMSLAHYDKVMYPAPLLVVAPASKVATGDWQRDIETYFEGRLLPEYEIYSYEKFSRNPTTAQYAKNGKLGVHAQYLRDHDNYFVIADECHRMANPQSGIGKAMYMVVRQAKGFAGLSATPLPNGWQSVANYFKIWGYVKHITEFKNRYCNIQTYKGFPEIVNYWHEDELQRLWNGMSKPLKKEQALDLPPLVSVPVMLEAGKDYITVLKQRMFDDKFLDNPSALLHALRQSTMDNKLPWLDEFIDGASGNVVIFYNYRREREAILKMLKKSHKNRTVFLQDGEYHQVPPKAVWDKLDRTITLAQYQSGSTGIEMTYADSTVYFSPTYSFVQYEQSVGRTYRNGQTKKCTLYMLCCRATVEKSIWQALRDKKDFDSKMWIKENLGGEYE